LAGEHGIRRLGEPGEADSSVGRYGPGWPRRDAAPCVRPNGTESEQGRRDAIVLESMDIVTRDTMCVLIYIGSTWLDKMPPKIRHRTHVILLIRSKR
jgi:hypothetical protein